jgi:hypothetical protein
MRRDTTHLGLDGPILRRKREGLIKGLKLAMEGEEIILALDARIEEHNATLDRLRLAAGPRWNENPDVVAVENRVRTLETIRDHIWEGHTYLLGRKDLEFAELLPEPGGREPQMSGTIEPFRPRTLD